MHVVDGASVVGGIDDGDDRGLQLAQIAAAADFFERPVLVEHGLEACRVRNLTLLDQRLNGGENPPVHRLSKVFGLEKVGDPFEGHVVGQQRPEQPLLDLDILRRLAQTQPRIGERRRRAAGHEAAILRRGEGVDRGRVFEIVHAFV